MKVNIGLIGCGNIGSEIAFYLESLEHCSLTRIYDFDPEAENRLIENLTINNPVKSTLSEILLHCDVVIEAASKEAVKQLLNDLQVLRTHNAFIIMSTGGLTENIDLFNALNRGQFHIPAGAIGGLDALKAVKEDLSVLKIKTTKPSASLTDNALTGHETILYFGDLNGAIEKFPKNINVAATLYLTTGFDDLQVQIISSSLVTRNCHEIDAYGSFGHMYFRFENEPSKNPKTSMLTLFSVKSMIDRVLDEFKLMEV